MATPTRAPLSPGKRAALRALAGVSHDSVEGLATNHYGKGAAALGLGIIDETAQRFEKAATIKPSTAAVALGLVSRVLNLDADLPRVRAANTATLLGAGPVKIYELGRWITRGLKQAAGPVMPTSGLPVSWSRFVSGLMGTAGRQE